MELLVRVHKSLSLGLRYRKLPGLCCTSSCRQLSDNNRDINRPDDKIRTVTSSQASRPVRKASNADPPKPPTKGSQLAGLISDDVSTFEPCPYRSYHEFMSERTNTMLFDSLKDTNPFEEMLKLKGQAWDLPVDNEQGFEPDPSDSFERHVMFRHMIDLFQSRGPVRAFMESFLAGVEQNKDISPEDKLKLISWYHQYFSQFNEVELKLENLDPDKEYQRVIQIRKETRSARSKITTAKTMSEGLKAFQKGMKKPK